MKNLFLLTIAAISILMLFACAQTPLEDIEFEEDEFTEVPAGTPNIITKEDFPEPLFVESTDGKGLEESEVSEIEPEVFFQSDSKIHSAILVDDGRLYFGTENCKFYAVDIATKEVLWEYDTDVPVETWPVISNGAVIFNAGNILRGLDAASGNEVFWALQPTEKVPRVSDNNFAFNDSYAAVFEDTVYYANLDGDITAVNMDEGDIIWTFPQEEPGLVTSGVNFWDGRIYYVCGGWLCCHDAQTGEPLFRVEINDGVYAPMTIDDGKIYLGGRSCKTYCIDAVSGEVIWSSFSSVPSTWFSGGSVVIGDMLYACTSDEFALVAYDRQTGKFNRLYPTGAHSYTKPVVYGENVIVAATNVYTLNESYVMEFDTKNHTKLWEASLPDCVLSSPSIYQDVLYFGSDSGAVYSIDLKSK